MLLVSLLVDEFVLADPRHHRAQPGAHLFDRMRRVAGPRRLKGGLIDLVLEHPVAGEFAGLDVLQNPLHLRLGLAP